MLVPHMPNATAIIILFLSQMAILAALMSFVRTTTEKKRTFGVRSTAKRKRVLNKLRSKEKGKKNGD